MKMAIVKVSVPVSHVLTGKLGWEEARDHVVEGFFSAEQRSSGSARFITRISIHLRGVNIKHDHRAERMLSGVTCSYGGFLVLPCSDVVT